MTMSHETDSPITPEEMLAVLQQLATRIPHFTILTQEQSLAIRRAATLDPEWVNKAVFALDESSVIERAIGNSYEELRDEIEIDSRWAVVESQLATLMRGVKAANVLRRHAIGLKALQIYGIAKQLVRQPEHMHLISLVEELTNMNKLGKRKKKGEGEKGEREG
jgi:hypothetical protein